MEQEIWKDIAEYEGKYQISNLGRVKSFINKSIRRELILKPRKHNTGYYSIALCKESNVKYFLIHRLVANAFILNLNNYNSYLIVCDHINGIKTDNNVNNIRVVTKRENCSVCFRKDKSKFTSKYVGVSKAKVNSRWTSMIQINGISKHLGYFDTEIEASNAYQAKIKEIESAEHGVIIDFPSIETIKE